MGLNVNDSLDSDFVGLPFFDEIFEAGADGLESSGLGDFRRYGNHAVVEGFGVLVVALKDGIPGIADRGIDTKSAHDEE